MTSQHPENNPPAPGELIEAIHQWDAELVGRLLEQGADPHEKDIAGHSAIDIANWYDQPEITGLIKEALQARNHRADPAVGAPQVSPENRPEQELQNEIADKHLKTLRKKRPAQRPVFKKKQP